MGSLTVTEFMTLDGVGQAPGGPEEDRAGGFAHGGWQAPFVDHESAVVVVDQAKTMDALLLGRRTYEIFAAHWPTAPKEIPFTALLNRVPKHVATRTPRGPLAWEGASVVTSELAELKRRYAEIHVIGSLDLVQPLLRAGLVDRLRLWQFPLLLGNGKRVFADGAVPAALRLTESTPFPTARCSSPTSWRARRSTATCHDSMPRTNRQRPRSRASVTVNVDGRGDETA